MKRKLNVFKTASNLIVTPPRLQYENDGGKQPSQVAIWIKPQHRVFFLLTVSLYEETPRQSVGGYRLIPEMSRLRVGVWKNASNKYFIGCKGTSVIGPTAYQDLADDAAIAGLISVGANDVSLVQEADKILHTLVKAGISTSSISIGGHSLGGYAALVISTRHQLHCCVFNAAAPPTKPLLVGPGPGIATHYHVVGDFISSHMLGTVAEIIRVDKNHNYFFSSIWAHSTDRFYEQDETLGFMNADQEDVLFMALGALAPLLMLIPGAKLPGLIGKVSEIAGGQPIPGSQRSFTNNSEDNTFIQLFKSGNKLYRMSQQGTGYIDLIDLEVGKVVEYFENMRSIALLSPSESAAYAVKSAERAKDGVLVVKQYTSYLKAKTTEATSLIEDLSSKLVADNVQPAFLLQIEQLGYKADKYVDDIYRATKASFGFNSVNQDVGYDAAMNALKTPTLSALAQIEKFNEVIRPQLNRLSGVVPLVIISAIDQEIFNEPNDELSSRQRAEEIFIKFRLINIKVEKVLNNMTERGFELAGAEAFYAEAARSISTAKMEVATSFLRAGEAVYGATSTAAEKLVAQAIATNIGTAVIAGTATVAETSAVLVRSGLSSAERTVARIGETALARAGSKVAAKVAQIGGRTYAQAFILGSAAAANPIFGGAVLVGETLLNIYFLVDLGVSIAELGWALSKRR